MKKIVNAHKRTHVGHAYNKAAVTVHGVKLHNNITWREGGSKVHWCSNNDCVSTGLTSGCEYETCSAIPNTFNDECGSHDNCGSCLDVRDEGGDTRCTWCNKDFSGNSKCYNLNNYKSQCSISNCADKSGLSDCRFASCGAMHG